VHWGNVYWSDDCRVRGEANNIEKVPNPETAPSSITFFDDPLDRKMLSLDYSLFVNHLPYIPKSWDPDGTIEVSFFKWPPNHYDLEYVIYGYTYYEIGHGKFGKLRAVEIDFKEPKIIEVGITVDPPTKK
jgi:hypothetical protein